MAKHEPQKQVFYTPRQIAEILGVAVPTVRELCMSGRLPHLVLNRRILISIRDVSALARVPDHTGRVRTPEAEIKRKKTLAENRAKGVVGPLQQKRNAKRDAAKAAAAAAEMNKDTDTEDTDNE